MSKLWSVQPLRVLWFLQSIVKARCCSSAGKYASLELVEDSELIVHLLLAQSDGRVAVTGVCRSGLVDGMIVDCSVENSCRIHGHAMCTTKTIY